ncbi:MAG TPA: efflux RND transporter periplasmic adaptor subunit [Thermodesulfovibrionales bacterium]|nr:efflux RND transporter periplasmic adaptor subunit [Thermodesulfovibrionales bacterium]
MTKRLRATFIIACHSILAISLMACSADTHKQANSYPVPVIVGKVQKVQERETVFVSGTVSTPDSPAEVSFLVSGKVIFVGPREGDYVKRGQRLASIDPIDYQLALTTATKQADMARIAFERAEDEHRRMKMLFDSKSLAPNDYEKYKATYESDRQQYEQAIAQEKISRKRLTDAELHSPVNGFISKRSIEPGETASPGRPVFEIVELDTVEANVGVPETDIHLVKIGQKVFITIPAFPKQAFEGTVRIINVSADPGTRTYMTRIRVPNPGHVIRIGMVAEAKIVGDQKISMMTLPGEAIVRDDQGATMVFIYFPKQQRVYSKRVKIGRFRGTEVEIKEGLSGDESIVIAGQDHLLDGMSVTIAPPSSEKASDKQRESAQ